MSHFFVRSHQQIAACRARRRKSIGQGRKTRGTARQHGKSVTLQLQITNNLGTKQAVDIAPGGDFKPGPDSSGTHAPSEKSRPSKDETLLSRTGKISSRDQAVVTRANNDGVV